MTDEMQRWSVVRRLVFRLAASYFILYLLTLGLSALFEPLVSVAGKMMHLPADKLVSAHNGSGDTTYHYMQILCILLLAPVAAIVWSIADRKRLNYRSFSYWLQVVLSYVLMFYLLIYGLGKVCMMQFQFPSLVQLVKPFGQSSPMGVAWKFMGYSYAFNVFTGVAEALGGVLLFFRRTRTIGALLSMTVLGNIVAMNFCYDIPVKIFSAHLFLMAAFIASADFTRLTALFFLNRPVPPSDASPRLTRDWNVVRIVTKSIVGLAILGMSITRFMSAGRYGHEVIPPLYGIYDVERIEKNSIAVPLVISDSLLWRQLVFERYDRGCIKTMNERVTYYSTATDTLQRKIVFTQRDSTDSMAMYYERMDTSLLVLRGMKMQDTLCITLRKKSMNDFLLINRGFHWVNEYPYNR